MSEYVEIENGLFRVFENGIIQRRKGAKYVTAVQSGSRRYRTISATINGNQKHYYVHRLLAQAFIPNPENKPHINHKDGNKQNNSLNNLEWCTPKENREHARLTGLYNPELNTRLLHESIQRKMQTSGITMTRRIRG